MKYILANTPKGQYLIPLLAVAEDRANYYAVDVDGHEKGSPEYQEEVKFCLNDSYEGIDWLLNNTNWKEWEDIAIKETDRIDVTDNDFWTCSDDFEIIDKE